MKKNKKRRITQESQVRWETSYGDVVTLLLVFFVILISMAKPTDQRAGKGDKDETLQKGYKTVAKKLDKKRYKKVIKLKKKKKEFSIVLHNTVLFHSGSAELTNSGFRKMRGIARLLKKIPETLLISIEGHTDDVPIISTKYPNNWSLSAARSLNIVGLFQGWGIDPARMRLEGYGEFKPMAPNRNNTGQPIPENMAKNRRVEIRVSSEKT